MLPTKNCEYSENKQKGIEVYDFELKNSLKTIFEINLFRNFVVSKVIHTNLYLVVVESHCGACRTNMQDSDLMKRPGESQDNIFSAKLYN